MTTSIKHIRQFHSPISQLFPDAIQLPQFFKTNLIDDLRVVKYFHNDPQANIKIFYYQYLKLCFEIDNVDYQSYIEKIYQLIRTEGFEFYFEPQDEQKGLKNAQYKSLLVDFFELMNSSSMTIDTVLKQYPILNDVFTNFFRTVVMIASIAPSYDSYIDKNQLFDFLSSFFSVDISSYDKCLKFVESDIFVYQDDQYNIYMAYIAEELEEKVEEEEEGDRIEGLRNQMKTVKQDEFESEVSAKSEQNHQLQQQQQHPLAVRLVQHSATNSSFQPSPDYTLKPRARTIIKESYIQSQFADYTSFSNIPNTFGQNILTSTQKEVFVEELEPTVNQTQTDMGENGNREVQGDRLLMRVKSAQNAVLLTTTTMPSPIQPIPQTMAYTSPQTQQQLSKATSQPNFFTREKLSTFHQQFPQSSLQHSKNIKPQHHFEQIPEHQSYGDSRHSSCNVIPGEKQQVKRNIVCLGLEQNNMCVSYQQPTKDPGFLESVVSGQVEKLSSQQLPSYSTNYPLTVNQPNSLRQQTTFTKPLPSYQLDQPLFYKPSKQTYTQSLFPQSRMVESLNSQKQQFYNINSKNVQAGGTLLQSSQRLKLNITSQFTNSIVMKCMSQPSKTQVHMTRQRARNYRKNIYRQLINYNTNSNGGVQQGKISYGTKVRLQQSDNNTSNKLPTRISFPSETSLKTVSTSNPVTTTTRQQFSHRNNPKQQTLTQQQTQSANIYPMSMLIYQQPKTISNSSNYQQLLTKTSTTNTFNVESNTALSKISQLKEIEEVISSPQSKRSLENRPYERVVQEKGSQLSKVNVSIYQSAEGTAVNNTYKLPSYQSALNGKKTSATQQQPYVYQPVYQSQLNKAYYNGTQTVMPHYLHSPQKTISQQLSMSKTSSQNLLSLLPQTQKPLPLYVPFERRK